MWSKIIIIVIFAKCFPLKVIGQDHCYNCNRDSLKAVLKVANTAGEKIEILSLLIDFVPTSDSANQLIKELLQLNAKSGKNYAAAYEKLYEANSYFLMKDYDKALSTYKRTVELFDSQKKKMPNLLLGFRNLFNLLNRQEERYRYYKDKLDYYLVQGPFENTAACYHGMGGYFTYTADYNQAISHYLKGAGVFRKFYTYWYYNALGIVGIYYAEWGNLDKALAYLNTAMPVLDSLQNLSPSTETVTGYYEAGIAKIKIKQQQYAEALQYAGKLIVRYESRQNDRFYALGLLLKGLVHIHRKEPAEAYPLLARVKKLSDSIHNSRMTTFNSTLEIDYGLYQYFHLVQDNKSAEVSLLQAYKTAVAETSVDLQLKYLKELSSFYLRQKDLQATEKYNTAYFELEAKIQASQNSFKVAQYENEKTQLDQLENINNLKSEKEKIQLQSKIRSFAFIAGIAVFLVVFFLLYRNNRTRRKANTLLQIQNKEIEQQKKNVEKTLVELKATQTQLIQSEKMASLGELTAGIAHEIQNPLNFVNNFSEVNKELVDELQQELKAGKIEDAIEISNDIKANEEKINHHGKRADAIVKGMLQHSRSSSGQKEPVNINTLADEYLRLSYHGLRAKDKSFNAAMKTEFDQTLPPVNIVPQDIGRVILNLVTNAFYAASLPSKGGFSDPDYVHSPTVWVRTKKEGNRVLISVRDNGPGVPKELIEKIFQPFFTTKPTGQGTGLGLSLSYDIVKAHGGEIKIQTKHGEGSTFVILLPIN